MHLAQSLGWLDAYFAHSHQQDSKDVHGYDRRDVTGCHGILAVARLCLRTAFARLGVCASRSSRMQLAADSCPRQTVLPTGWPRDTR